MKDTMELRALKVSENMSIGIIGTGPGAGVTFLCNLLKREYAQIRCRQGTEAEMKAETEIAEIETDSGDMNPDCLLIVVDSGKQIDGRTLEALRIIKKRNTKYAVVLNFWNKNNKTMYEAVMSEFCCLTLPMLEVRKLEEIFNFVYYS